MPETLTFADRLGMEIEDGLDDLEKDSIGAHDLKVDQNKYFDWTSVINVELPVSEHNGQEVIEAKKI